MTLEYTDTPSTILIVDDDPFGIVHLQSLLRNSGYEIITAPDGRAAIELIRKQPPDIILLDIIMPEMDGYETCRRLKEDTQFADIPVLFLSGLNSPDEKVNAFEAGGVDYITKPFSEKEVLVRVKTHLTMYRLKKGLIHEISLRADELQDKTSEIQDANTALKILLSAIEREKRDLAERVRFNADKLILPRIRELSEAKNADVKQTLFSLIEQSFQELTTSLAPGNLDLCKTLTPMELQIVSLIKQGKASKEISQICCISASTIATHRKSIRKKLKITNKGTNLYSFLSSL
jgi:DNA-binding response OmpR family regulator